MTLVGALSADMSLNIPDYLASEKTFQLLTQVAGRAGRGILKERLSYKPIPLNTLPYRGLSLKIMMPFMKKKLRLEKHTGIRLL